MNFRRRMMFTILPIVGILLLILGYNMYTSTYNILEDNTRDELEKLSQEYSNQLSQELANYIMVSNNYTGFLQDYASHPINERRSFYFNLTRKVLEYNKKVLSTWADFDKDALDGQDAQYANRLPYSASGRFNVAFHRGTGEIQAQIEEEPEAALEDDYYKLPRETGKICIIEPYDYSYTGDAKDNILMTTISAPIFNAENKVIGVSGVDISLSSIVDYINSIQPFDSSHASLFSETGLYIAAHNNELLGKSILDNSQFDAKLADSINKMLVNGERFDIDYITADAGTRKVMYFVPVQFGETDQRLVLAISVPFDMIVAQANNTLEQTIILFGLALLLISITIIVLAGMLSNPLKKLTKEFAKLSVGNFADMVLSAEGNDEVSDLSRGAIAVRDNVKDMVNEVERVANEVAGGNLRVLADVGKYGGDYKMLMLAMNKMLELIVNPVAKINDYMGLIAVGKFPEQIDESGYEFHIKEMMHSLNMTLQTLDNFRDAIMFLSEMAENGDLAKRADEKLFQGDWQKMVSGINNIVKIFSNLTEEVDATLNTMSTGDLTPRIHTIYSGSFENMKQNINNLGESLSALVSEIKNSVNITADSSNAITTSANYLSTVTSRQNENTAAIANDIEMMAGTVDANARSAIKTAEVANESGKVAKDGQKVVQNTITKMKEIAEVVKVSARNIQDLGDSSKKIGEIITVITDIADQTNLLSLNAAIEAARAGEQGRGFAVVADSVGKLAISTASATKEIATMIKQIQTDTSNAVIAMEKGTAQVNEGIELADEAGHSLTNILDSINELLEMINGIAESSKQQSEATENIANNIEVIKQDTVTSFQNVEDVTSNSTELMNSTMQLSEIVNNFKIG